MTESDMLWFLGCYLNFWVGMWAERYLMRRR